MLKRQYGIFKYPNGDIRLSIKFLDENYQTLGEFFIIYRSKISIVVRLFKF